MALVVCTVIPQEPEKIPTCRHCTRSALFKRKGEWLCSTHYGSLVPNPMALKTLP
jgi:hypothetical protein